MDKTISTLEEGRAIIEDIDNYYIGVEVDSNTYAKELNDDEILVRVFADNDNEDVGGKKLIHEFYMLKEQFKSLDHDSSDTLQPS